MDQRAANQHTEPLCVSQIYFWFDINNASSGDEHEERVPGRTIENHLTAESSTKRNQIQNNIRVEAALQPESDKNICQLIENNQ